MRIRPGAPRLEVSLEANAEAPEASRRLPPVPAGDLPRFSLGRLARRVATGAMLALTVGTSTLTPAAAAVHGATSPGAFGAPLTEVIAEAPGPGLELLRAQAPLSSAHAALYRAKTEAYGHRSALLGDIHRLEREVAELEPLAALPAGPAVAPSRSSDPALSAFDALLSEEPDFAAELAEAKAKLVEAQSRLPALEAAAREADAALDTSARMLEALDGQAEALLATMGLSEPALAAARGGALSSRPGATARAAGLLEVWSGRQGRDLTSLSPAELSAFFLADRVGFEVDLATLPADLFASPYDVMYAGSSAAATPEAVTRAAALADLGYRPMAQDLEALGRLSTSEFDVFSGFVQDLADAGLGFSRHYASRGPFDSEVRGEATQLLDLLPWRDAKGRAKVLAAAHELDARGIAVNPSHARLLRTLAKGGPTAARARALLDACATPTDPRDGDYAVFVARDLDRYGDRAQVTARLAALTETIGRAPTIGEAAQALEALASGSDLGALLPATPGAEGLPIADWYTWRHAPEAYRSMSAAGLRDALDARVGQPVLRMDSNAEYVETSSAGFSKPELIEMHMLLDALERPAVRAQLLSELSGDLSDGARERGGVVVVRDGAVAFDMHASAHDDEHSATYSLPAGVEPLHALVHFHFHAVRPQGERMRAGPSSVGQGQGGDVGVAYLYQQDLLVVSAVDVDAASEVTSFDVDFVSKSGAVRDLGTFQR